MLRLIMLLAGLLLTGALIGCGGNDSTSAPAPSRFAGTWSGPWTDNQGQSGTLTVTISTTGMITGSMKNTTLAQTGVANGIIQESQNNVPYGAVTID